jgi:hypothetical protein
MDKTCCSSQCGVVLYVQKQNHIMYVVVVLTINPHLFDREGTTSRAGVQAMKMSKDATVEKVQLLDRQLHLLLECSADDSFSFLFFVFLFFTLNVLHSQCKVIAKRVLHASCLTYCIPQRLPQ